MKAREYAISLGLAKQARGKLSREAHAAIQKAIAGGTVFEDYSDGKIIKKESLNGNRSSSSVDLSSTDSGSELGSLSDGASQSTQKVVAPIPESIVTHDYNVVWGIDSNGRSDLVIAFAHCSACFRAIKYCVHDIPKLPAWLGSGDALLVDPR
jgi:hypothetical protein